MAESNTSPMGQELPPKLSMREIDDIVYRLRQARKDTTYAIVNTAIAPYAERIRHLERELEQSRAAFKGSENARRIAEQVAERKPSSIDTPVFRALLSRVQGWKDGNALIDGAARALIAYIDGRTAGTAWVSVDDEHKPDVGTPVLVYVRTLTNGEDDDGHPYEEESAVIDMGEYRKAPYDGEHYFACFMSPISDNDWVTHWMPLPAAPTPINNGMEEAK